MQEFSPAQGDQLSECDYENLQTAHFKVERHFQQLLESKARKSQFLVQQAVVLLDKLFLVKELQSCIIGESFRSP